MQHGQCCVARCAYQANDYLRTPALWLLIGALLRPPPGWVAVRSTSRASEPEILQIPPAQVVDNSMVSRVATALPRSKR